MDCREILYLMGNLLEERVVVVEVDYTVELAGLVVPVDYMEVVVEEVAVEILLELVARVHMEFVLL
jgi:hypothetical protein